MSIADHPATQDISILSMKVGHVADILGSKANLADWVGVGRSQATRWSDGTTTPSPEAVRAVTDLEFIISRDSMVWDVKVIPDWLRGHNAFLEGATPLEMIRRGRTSEVLDAIDGDESGVFA